MSLIHLSLLGTSKLEKNGVLLHVERQKSLALLAYLAVTEAFYPRSHLATLLWPETAQAKAYTLLRHVLVDIRKNVATEILLTRGRTIGVDLQLIRTDVVSLRRLLKQPYSSNSLQLTRISIPVLQQATELFKGDFLADLSLSNSLPFEQWQAQYNQQLRQDMSAVFEYLVSSYVESQNYAQALHYAKQWLTLEPFQEKAHYDLMRLLAFQGQRHLALQQYETYKRLINQEQGTQPQEAIITLARAIRAGVKVEMAEGFSSHMKHVIPVLGIQSGQEPLYAGITPPSPWASQITSRSVTSEAWSNLPCETTPFIARPRETAQILKYLEDPTCRLLTLLGMGGVGKSRLALHLALEMLARQLSHPFEERIYFLSLEKCASLEEVLHSLVGVVAGISQEQAHALEGFTHVNKEQPALIILDECEHVTKEVHLISDLLQVAPHLKILATSRIRLNLPEEWCLEVAGLTYPQQASHYSNLDEMLQYGALQLFVQQARRTQTEFLATQDNLPYLVQICRTLDGLPLGIESAAQALRAFSCEEIAKALEVGDWEQIFPRNPPHLLWVSLERAWHLLPPEQQSALQKLSTLKGTFTLEAALALEIPKNALLCLSDQSWIKKDPQSRYLLPETIRQYGFAKLTQNPALAQTTQTLASRYYLAYLADLVPMLKGDGQPVALAQLEQEFTHILTAWEWAVKQAHGVLWTPAMEGLGVYLEMTNQYLLAYKLFSEALQHLGSEEKATQKIYGQCASWLGQFCMILGKLEEAEKLFKISLDMARQWNDQEKERLALIALGNITALRHDLSEAFRYYQELLSTEQQPEDLHEKARSLNYRGAYAQYRKDYHAAQHAYQESLEICFRIGDYRTAAFCFVNHGKLAAAQQDYLRAMLAFQQAQGLYRLVKDKAGEATCLKNLGNLEMELGNLKAAHQNFEQGLTISRALNHYLLTRSILLSLGKVLNQLGDTKTAHQTFQESLHINTQLRATSSVLTNLYYLAHLYHHHRDLLQHRIDQEGVYQLIIYLLHHPLTKEEIKHQAQALLEKIQNQFDHSQKLSMQQKIQHVPLETMVEIVTPKLAFV